MLDRITTWFAGFGANQLVRREEGQALVEYALILSLIALVCLVALQLIGTNISNLLTTIANAL